MFVDFTRDFVFGRETVTQKNLIEKAAIFNISLPKLFLPFCKYYLHHHFGRDSQHHQENILVGKKIGKISSLIYGVENEYKSKDTKNYDIIDKEMKLSSILT